MVVYGTSLRRIRTAYSVFPLIFLYTQMLAAIGETFETPLAGGDEKDAQAPSQSDLVTGVIVSSRPGL